MKHRLLAVTTAVIVAAIPGTGRAGADSPGYQYPYSCNSSSLTADFAARDALPHTDTPPSAWYVDGGKDVNRGWGPASVALPEVGVPADSGCDPATWKRERVLAAALHYINEPGNPQALLYRHHHIPDWDPTVSTRPAGSGDAHDADGRNPETWSAGRGLDCSNFTAWVYNFGLGVKFGGDVHKQYAGTAGPMGQHLSAEGPFELGDLLYLHPTSASDEASHVVIYVDDDHVIDSRLDAQNLSGVQIRQRQGWYRTAVLGGWRPIVG